MALVGGSRLDAADRHYATYGAAAVNYSLAS